MDAGQRVYLDQYDILFGILKSPVGVSMITAPFSLVKKNNLPNNHDIVFEYCCKLLMRVQIGGSRIQIIIHL